MSRNKEESSHSLLFAIFIGIFLLLALNKVFAQEASALDIALVSNVAYETSTTSALIVGDGDLKRYSGYSPNFVSFPTRNDSPVKSFADIKNNVVCYTFHTSISCVKL